MDLSISFFEFQLTRGNLTVVLGSGKCEAVLAREVPGPHVRICMRDPEVVKYRVRLGTAELTEQGLKYGDWDDFQLRGSSLRLFSWSLSVARWMTENERTVLDLLQRAQSPWLEYHEGVVSSLGEGVAKQILRTSLSGECRILICVQIPQEDADEFFVLLTKQLLAGET